MVRLVEIYKSAVSSLWTTAQYSSWIPAKNCTWGPVSSNNLCIPIGSVICWQMASLKYTPTPVYGYLESPLSLLWVSLCSYCCGDHLWWLANCDFVYGVPHRPNAYLADISNCVTTTLQTLYLIHLFIIIRSFSLFSLLPGCCVQALSVVKPSKEWVRRAVHFIGNCPCKVAILNCINCGKV